jgi:hypothetical protein
VIHHLSQCAFYVILQHGGNGFRGIVVDPCSLTLCELDPLLGLRSERANFVPQLLEGFRVLGLKICQLTRKQVVCFVNPGTVSQASGREHMVDIPFEFVQHFVVAF